MHRLVFILLVLMSTNTFAQENGNADALLQEVASAVRDTKNWRAEGIQSGEVTINGTETRDELRFKIAVQGASRMRWETGDADHTTLVCDGTDQWASYGQLRGDYYRNPISVSPCGAGIEVGDFLKVTDRLLSATVIGRDRVEFQGSLRECELVRAEYDNTVPDVFNDSPPVVHHTFCIDPSNRMVLRDQMEGSVIKNNTTIRITQTTTYLSYERNVAIPPETFRFVIPKGAIELKGP